MKRKTPAGRGLHKDLWGQGKSIRKNNSTVIPFTKPIRHPIGWNRLCCSCGSGYLKPYAAGTVRGLRGEGV
jgi:hypothetical protein